MEKFAGKRSGRRKDAEKSSGSGNKENAHVRSSSTDVDAPDFSRGNGVLGKRKEDELRELKTEDKKVKKQKKLVPRKRDRTGYIPDSSDKSTNLLQPASLDDDMVDFPRGKEAGEMEEERGRKGKKKKLVRTMNDAAEDDVNLSFTGKFPRFANYISAKNTNPGLKSWGVIMEINRNDMVVSLPGGLRGLVQADEALDALTEVQQHGFRRFSFSASKFQVGQLVSCVVIGLDKDEQKKSKPKISLSLRLSRLYKELTMEVLQEGMVLNAYVKSVEDYGYILHFGTPAFSGFYPKLNADDDVSPGQLLQGVITKIDRARRIVHINPDPDAASSFVMKETGGGISIPISISIDLILPGMMFSAFVRAVLNDGIMVSFMNYFTATIDRFHLPNVFPGSNWRDDFPKNKKVNARILFVNPTTRSVGMTLNPDHLLHRAPPRHVCPGEIFESAEVVRVDRSSGILLRIPSAPSPTPAYVNLRDDADEERQEKPKKFEEGDRVWTRITGFKSLDGLATASLKPSVPKPEPGASVKAKVVLVHDGGAIVELSGGTKALCPLSHMSEFERATPSKRFAVGCRLRFRVLGSKGRRLTVTHKKTLVRSDLKPLTSYSDAAAGLVTHGWISKVDGRGCFVRFYNGVQGFVPGADRGDDLQAGRVVKCRVTGSSPESRRIDLSLAITSPPPVKKRRRYGVGSAVSAEVVELRPLEAMVRFGKAMTGRIHITESIVPVGQLKVGQTVAAAISGRRRNGSWELSTNRAVGSDPSLAVGDTVTGFVTGRRADWVLLAVTRAVRAKLFAITGSFPTGESVTGTVVEADAAKRMLYLTPRDGPILEGDRLVGRVLKVLSGVGGLVIRVGPRDYGRVHYTDAADGYPPDPTSRFEIGRVVNCTAVGTGDRGRLRLSLTETEPLGFSDLHAGMAVHGYVKSVTPKGCFVLVSRHVEGRIQLRNLSDGYIENPEKEFPVGRLVKARVLSVDCLSSRLELSLRSDGSSAVHERTASAGDTVLGRVRRVEPFGLFIAIDGTSLVGLCHVSKIPAGSLGKYTPGDVVLAEVLSVDPSLRRVSLSIATDPAEPEPSELPSDMDSVLPLEVPSEDDVGCDRADGDVGGDGAETRAATPSRAERELLVAEAEDRMAEDGEPTTEEEFERAVRRFPSSSFVWIKYVSFALGCGGPDAARTVVERALVSVPAHEESERMNVWVAYMNLEDGLGGDPSRVFDRALPCCDAERLHLALLGLYQRTERWDRAEELMERMVRRFRGSVLVWLQRVRTALARGTGAGPFVSRALMSLPRRDHVKFIARAAVMEFRCGSADRGRSMFEGVLREFPKRTDVWSVYVDQEVRLGDADSIRSLFERATSLSIPPKKMEFLFKKYLDYEKSSVGGGVGDRVEYVKRKAMEYVESCR